MSLRLFRKLRFPPLVHSCTHKIPCQQAIIFCWIILGGVNLETIVVKKRVFAFWKQRVGMESNQERKSVGYLQDELLHHEDNNIAMEPSLSEIELQEIKKELGMLDDSGALENSTMVPPSIFVDGDEETPSDLPFTEQERALLEKCTIGSPRRFSETPSVGSASLEQLADTLIRDFEDMDSDDDTDRGYFNNDFEGARGTEASFHTRSDVVNDMNQERNSKVYLPHLVDENGNYRRTSKGVLMRTVSKSPKMPHEGGQMCGCNVDAFSSSTDSRNSSESPSSRSLSLDSDSLPASIDSDRPMRDVVIPQHRFFVVVAIDFGTTFSGYAFAFTRDPSSIHMMRRWEGGDPGVTNQKTPTSLLLRPDGTFHSFGFGARDFYHDLEPEDAKKWMYFEKFKMSLHTNKVREYSQCCSLSFWKLIVKELFVVSS